MPSSWWCSTRQSRGRRVTAIVLDENNAECNYPGPYWTKGVQPGWATRDADGAPVCRDTFASSIPWTTDCGLVRSENATHVTFQGHGTVRYEDALGQLDGVSLGAREVASIVRFQIDQPKVIRDISTTVRIVDEPRLLGAVTRQLFDYVSGTATLTLVLSMAAPLRTLSIASIAAPGGIAMTPISSDDAFCPDDASATCQQKYNFLIDPQELCELDGAYTVSLNVGCHPSIVGTPECPATATQAPLSVTAELDSEDLCAVVQGLLTVDGAMTSHGEFDSDNFVFGDIKSAFFQDQTMHFQVVADSLNGFPFAETSIMLIEAEDKDGARQTIYDSDAGGATDGWSLQVRRGGGRRNQLCCMQQISRQQTQLSQDPMNSGAEKQVQHRHQFQFLAAPTVFGDVLRSEPVNSTIVVAVRVAFDNPVGPGAGGDERKRTVLTREHRLMPRQVVSNIRAAEASATFVVEAAEAEASELLDAKSAPTADDDIEFDNDALFTDAAPQQLSASALLFVALAALNM